jgi:hypothetical protein
MSKHIPAFPRPVSMDIRTDTFAPEQDGMTLRDYFAAKAMQSFLDRNNTSTAFPSLAAAAYRVADVMLEARKE